MYLYREYFRVTVYIIWVHGPLGKGTFGPYAPHTEETMARATATQQRRSRVHKWRVYIGLGTIPLWVMVLGFRV